MQIAKSMIAGRLTTDYVVLHFIPSFLRGYHEVQKTIREIEEIIEQFEVRLLVLNCSRLKAATSRFFGQLIWLNKQCQEKGIEMRLCCMTDLVREGYRTLKLKKLIRSFRTEEQAVA